ncbi:MAG: hypothetical protein WD991_01540 [Candidatus Paceibacterota bacterium]
MDTLVVTQTLFYLIASLAMIVLGVLLGMVIYQLIRILKKTRQMSEDIGQTYDTAKKGVAKLLSSVFQKSKKYKRK